MEIFFNFGLFSSILLFFVVSKILFAVAFYRRGWINRHHSDKWMSFLISLCALYLIPWMCGHAGWYAKDGYREFLFYIPFHQYFLFGPVIYFTTKFLIGSKDVWNHRSWFHFIPALLYLIYSGVIAVFDFYFVDEPYFYSDGLDKDYEKWYQVVGMASMMIYVYLSIKLFLGYQKNIFQEVSYADSIKMSWLKRFLIVFIVMIAFRWVFTILFVENGEYGFKFWYYFLFGVLGYYLSFAGYYNTIMISSVGLLPQRPEGIKEEENTSSISSAEIPSLLLELEQKLVSENLYKNSSLSLAQLAKSMGTNSSMISKVINEGAGINFNDFVNKYRVQEIKRVLKEGLSENKTLEGIAYDAGFNSKSTFLRAFKKFTRMTPSQYKNTQE